MNETSLRTLLIRPARPEDGPPIRRMVFDVLREYGVPPEPHGSDADVMDFGASRVPGVVHLVAEYDGQAVGSAILTPCGRYRVKLSKLFLRRDMRGRGIGRRLLDAAVREARVAGYAEIFLTTRAVYTQAVHLYESSGWWRGPDLPPPGPDRLYHLPLGHPGSLDGPGGATPAPTSEVAA